MELYKLQIVTINNWTANFYRLNALPITQPTVSEHWMEKYHIPWTCSPQAHLGSSNFVTTDSSWLPWGRVAMLLVSPLMPVPYNAQQLMMENEQQTLTSVRRSDCVPTRMTGILRPAKWNSGIHFSVTLWKDAGDTMLKHRMNTSVFG